MSVGGNRTLHFLLFEGYLECCSLIMAKYILKAGGVQRQARTYLITMTLARLLILFITMKISYWDVSKQKVQNHDYLFTAVCSAFPRHERTLSLKMIFWGGSKGPCFSFCKFVTVKVTKQVTFEKYSSFTLIRLQSSDDWTWYLNSSVFANELHDQHELLMFSILNLLKMSSVLVSWVEVA